MVVNKEVDQEKTIKDALALSIIEKLMKDRANRFLQTGNYLLSKGQLASAELCFDQVIQQDAQEKEKKTVISALIGKSEILKRRERFEEAYQALTTAEAMAQDFKKLLGLVYQQRADIASAEDRPSHALDFLKKAREAFLQAEEETPADRARVALLMGLAAHRLFRFQDALGHHQEAEELARELDKGDTLLLFAKLGEADALSALGRARESLRKCEMAREILDRAKLDDREKLLLLVVKKKASNLEALGELEVAARLYEDALISSSALVETAKLCAQLAPLKFSMGLPREAREYEERAKSMLSESGEEAPEVLLNLSRLNLMRGQIHTADKQFFQALTELPHKDDKGQALQIRSRRISLYMQQGKFRAASELAHSLYDELSETGVDALLPSVLQTMGNLARIQGDLDDAERFFGRALEIAGPLNIRLTTATALSGLAQVAAARFETDAASEYLEKAIDISRDCGAKLNVQALQLERATLRHQGDEGTPQDAEELIRSLQDQLRESERLECLSLELAIRTALATVHWQAAHHTEAEGYLRDIVEEAAQAGMTFTKIIAQGSLGSVLSDQGEKAQAETYLSDALSELEDLGLDIEAKYEFHERYRELTGFWF